MYLAVALQCLWDSVQEGRKESERGGGERRGFRSCIRAKPHVQQQPISQQSVEQFPSLADAENALPIFSQRIQVHGR